MTRARSWCRGLKLLYIFQICLILLSLTQSRLSCNPRHSQEEGRTKYAQDTPYQHLNPSRVFGEFALVPESRVTYASYPPKAGKASGAVAYTLRSHPLGLCDLNWIQSFSAHLLGLIRVPRTHGDLILVCGVVVTGSATHHHCLQPVLPVPEPSSEHAIKFGGG